MTNPTTARTSPVAPEDVLVFLRAEARHATERADLLRSKGLENASQLLERDAATYAALAVRLGTTS